MLTVPKFLKPPRFSPKNKTQQLYLNHKHVHHKFHKDSKKKKKKEYLNKTEKQKETTTNFTFSRKPEWVKNM